jgi:two-component system, NarL family, nitrate/nitrite response regulator NarL
VAIAENNQMSGDLLAAALKRDRGLDVIGSFVGYSNVSAAVRNEAPDVLLIAPDLGNEVGSGFRIISELRAEKSLINIVVLLDSTQHDQVVEAFRCGATGVFCKSYSIKLLCKCISRVHAGQVWANSRELRLLLEALARSVPSRLVNTTMMSSLTDREMDVVRCLAEGLSNREIAQRLSIRTHTVKNYLSHVFNKLGVSSRVEAVLYASGQCRPFLLASSKSNSLDNKPQRRS